MLLPPAPNVQQLPTPLVYLKKQQSTSEHELVGLADEAELGGSRVGEDAVDHYGFDEDGSVDKGKSTTHSKSERKNFIFQWKKGCQ